MDRKDISNRNSLTAGNPWLYYTYLITLKMVSENTTDDKWFNSSLTNSLVRSLDSSSGSSLNNNFFRKGLV